MSWNEGVFKAAFVHAGMWTPVLVLYAGTDVPFELMADWCAPSVNPFTGAQSTDYEIEYEYADAPELDEGDQVVKDGAFYRIRQSPRVDGIDPTGHFRKVLLTRIGPVC